MECLRIQIVDRWFNMRPDGVTRGKWIIPDEKVGEWSIVIFGAQNVVDPTYVD
jgi:hypothetical protein